MATKQSTALSQANVLVNIVQSFQSLRAQINEFINQYNSEAYNTTWAALATAAQNGDGSLGAADGTPNVAHPIDTRIFTAMNRTATQTQLVAGVTLLQDFQKFLTNQAVTTAQRSQTVDDLAS